MSSWHLIYSRTKKREATSRVLGYSVPGNSCTAITFLKKAFYYTYWKARVPVGSNCRKGSSNHFVISFKTNFTLGRDVKPPEFWNEGKEILIYSYRGKTNLKWKSKVGSQGDDCFSSVLVTQSHFLFTISHVCSITSVKINNCPSNSNIKDELFCVKIGEVKVVFSYFFSERQHSQRDGKSA